MADAQTALRLHAAAGGPDSAPIFFSVDEDIDLDTWKSVAVEWFRGINSVLGVNRTGMYGHSRTCAWAIDDGVIGRSTTAGALVGVADEGVVWWRARAQGGDLSRLWWSCGSDPGVLLGGTHVDVDEVLATDFGQWDLDRTW